MAESSLPKQQELKFNNLFLFNNIEEMSEREAALAAAGARAAKRGGRQGSHQGEQEHREEEKGIIDAIYYDKKVGYGSIAQTAKLVKKSRPHNNP